MRNHPVRLVAALVLAGVALATLTFVVGSRIGAGGQVRAVEPAATVVTAPVTLQPLSDGVELQCSPRWAHRTAVAARPPYAGADAVITMSPRRDRVRSGDVLVEVAGRPVLALQGRFRGYRDLGPGTEGPDVAQLQRALRASGIDAPSTGRFDPATQRAVRALYASRGYPPPGGTKATTVPQNELAFVPVLPASVVDRPAVGAEPDTLAVLRSGGSSFDCTGPDLADVRRGMGAEVAVPSGQVRAEVGAVRAATDTAEGSVRIDPYRPVPRTATTGRVVLESTEGAVLTVPVAALGGAADAAQVLVATDGEPRPVAVRAGVSAQGRVEVVPTPPGALRAGDRVVVSR